MTDKTITKEQAAAALEPELQAFMDAYSAAAEGYDTLVERLSVLEDQFNEPGWVRLSATAESDFSRTALNMMCKQARVYWLKNPLIRRAVVTQTTYVWAQGVTIRAEHPTVDTVVQRFLEDKTNESVLGDTEAKMRLENELQLFGNLFFTLFRNPSTGTVKVRTIPFAEIETVITNPEDAADPWYYLRTWTTTVINATTGAPENRQQKAYYPDWRYSPAGGHPVTIGDIPVREAKIYHVAVNRLNDMQFGVSEVYAACDWARSYKEFLEDWTTIVKALSQFAHRLTVKGGSGAVATAKNQLQALIANPFAQTGEAQQTMPTGSTFISGEGAKLEPMKTAGVTTSCDDARRLMLMVCSATGIYEHYLTGDPSTGNLATAKSMERPMELQFLARQGLWQSVLTNILGYVIDEAAVAPNGPLHQGALIDTDDDGDRIVTLATDPDTGDPMSRKVEVRFPPLLEHDQLAKVDAIIGAGTLKGGTPAGTIPLDTLARLLLDALEVPNASDLVAEWFPEGYVPPSPGTQEALSALATVVGRLESYLREAEA